MDMADEHRILYDHLRGHMGIEEEKTTAQKAGIKTEFMKEGRKKQVARSDKEATTSSIS